MTTGIDSIILNYANSLNTADRKPLIVRHYSDEIIKALKKAKLEIDGYHIIGSYMRETMVGPLVANNVDVLVELNPARYKQWHNSDATHHVMRVFRESLNHAFPKLAVQQEGHEVTVQFPDFRVDVIPAMRWHTGCYVIPDEQQEKWIYTDPQKFAERLAMLNQRHGGMLLPLIKIIRAWNRSVESPLRGFHIEAMVLRRHDGTGRFGGITQTFPAALCDMFMVLPTMIEQPCVDPQLNQRLDLYLGEGSRQLKRGRASDHAGDASDLATAAYDLYSQGRMDESLALWGQLFGRSFLMPA
jgi:hypothetical protein